MQKDIDEIYRQLQEQQQEFDTADVWERIDESLDLEKTWVRLDDSLMRRRRRKIAGFTLVGLLLPMIGIGIYLIGEKEGGYYYTSESGTASKEPQVVIDTPDNVTILYSSAFGNFDGSEDVSSKIGAYQDSVNSQFNQVVSIVSQSANRTSLASKVPYSKEGDSLKQVKQLVSEGIAPRSMTPIAVRFYNLKTSSAHGTISIPAPSDTNTRSGFNRYYIMCSTGIKTTWLLNNHTYKSLRSESFEYLQRQYYPIAAVGFGMLHNDKYFFEGNFVMLDFGGQHVNYMNEGRSIQLQTRLQYITLELNGGYRFKRILYAGQLNIFPTVYFGIYSSALVRSKIITNELNADRNKSFRTGDFGVTCRIAFSLPVGDKMHVQAGIGMQTGVVNISRTQADIPAYFDRSFNASGAAFISAKYFLR